MTLYTGLDVHGKETLYAAQDESGKVTAQGKVATSAEGFCELVETLESPKGTKIGLETGTQALIPQPSTWRHTKWSHNRSKRIT